MKQANDLKNSVAQIAMVRSISSTFETIASVEMSKIRESTLASKKFFGELWNIYTQLRRDPKEVGQTLSTTDKNKSLFVVVTAESGLTGDIDQKTIAKVLIDLDPANTDVIVVGAHGGGLLSGLGHKYDKLYRWSEMNDPKTIQDLGAKIKEYGHAVVYFSTYLTLVSQEVVKQDMVGAIRALGTDNSTQSGVSVISTDDYLFEPTDHAVMNYMESVMMELALNQIMRDSQLAQLASRFKAMSASKNRAKDIEGKLRYRYHKAQRARKDEQSRERTASILAQGLL